MSLTFLHNQPAGSDRDPRNPENINTDLCCNCDSEEIDRLWWAEEERLAEEMSDADGDLTTEQCKEIDHAEDEFKLRFRECRSCAMDNE